MAFPSLSRKNSTKLKEEENDNPTTIVTVGNNLVKRSHDHEPHSCKPVHHDYWIRTVDINESIFYYNVKTGENSWLMPCCICYRVAEKFCLECSASFCERHFIKRHENNGDDHHWKIKEEGNREELKVDEEYCISCLVKRATKMCTECWDPFCTKCFQLVHSVGYLKTHNSENYYTSKQNWHVIKRNGKGSDYFFHGTTKVSTYEKPPELMNRTERQYYDDFMKYKMEADNNVDQIDALQFELEKLRFSKDSMVVQMQDLMNTLKKKDSI